MNLPKECVSVQSSGSEVRVTIKTLDDMDAALLRQMIVDELAKGGVTIRLDVENPHISTIIPGEPRS